MNAAYGAFNVVDNALKSAVYARGVATARRVVNTTRGMGAAVRDAGMPIWNAAGGLRGLGNYAIAGGMVGGAAGAGYGYYNTGSVRGAVRGGLRGAMYGAGVGAGYRLGAAGWANRGMATSAYRNLRGQFSGWVGRQQAVKARMASRYGRIGPRMEGGAFFS